MRIKKNYFYGAIIVIILLIAGIIYFKHFSKKEVNVDSKNETVEWLVDENGYLSYPLERRKVKFSYADLENNGSLLVRKVIFQSRNGNVYGLLVMPTSAEELPPGIVLLPGAGVSKESELELAKNIAEFGAVVLVLDQRGTGETNGYFPSLDEDFQSFLDGQDPVQHLMVYDALMAYDLLDNAPFVDSGRIAVMGESLGGRIAVIAAAIDRNIDGVIVISSAGFDFREKGDREKDRFLKSIDSDHYIGLVSPRELVMIHSLNDTNIPLQSAIKSFEKAHDPKEFVLINKTGCNHGYCDAMWDKLVDALDYVVEIRSRTLISIPDK